MRENQLFGYLTNTEEHGFSTEIRKRCLILYSKASLSDYKGDTRTLYKSVHAIQERITTALYHEFLRRMLEYLKTKAFPLKKQRLHLRTVKTEIEPCLKGHKLTIQVDRLKDFTAQITQGILSFLQTQDECDESDITGVQKELERRKQKPTSDLNRLSEALIRHSLARLHRAAQLHYLRYLYKGIQEWHAPAQKVSLPLLGALFNRLEKTWRPISVILRNRMPLFRCPTRM